MFYLVDFENVKNEGMLGLENLSEEDMLIIFYSKNVNTISINNHIKLEKTKFKKEYIETKVATNNALDFQLVSYLGFLIAKYPDSSYAIISKDRGFEAVIHFWKEKEIDIDIFVNLSCETIQSEKVQIEKAHNNSALRKELEALLPQHLDKASFVESTINKYKTKQGVNNALVKQYKSETAGIIYKAIKPLIKNKKGKE